MNDVADHGNDDEYKFDEADTEDEVARDERW